MFELSLLVNHFVLSLNAANVLVLDRKEQRWNIRHTSCSLYSAVSEDMLWLCKRTPQHAIADLHMLAADIVSTCPSHIPRCPVSSLVIVWSRQSFISSASGSVGLGQIWEWEALSGSLRRDYYLNITAFLAQKLHLYMDNRQKKPLVKKACLDKSVVFVHRAAGIRFIYPEVKQWLILFCSGFDCPASSSAYMAMWDICSIRSNSYTSISLEQ